MRSQERTSWLQLGSIPITPVKAERAWTTYLVCKAYNSDAGRAMKGCLGFLGVHIATKAGREKRENLVRRWTDRQPWHDTNHI